MTAWLLARRFAEALIAGLIAGIVLLVLAPVVIGWRPYTVLTGSMRPGIQPGDVVMDRPISVIDAHVGQVVTFSDPTRHGELVTHRIRSIAHLQGVTNVETRGDANNTSEHWTIKTSDRVGLVVYTLPKIGKIAVVVRTKVGILLVIVVPVLLLAIGLLRKIWSEDDGDEPGVDGKEPAEPPVTPEDPAAAETAEHPTVVQPDAQSSAERAGSAADR